MPRLCDSILQVADWLSLTNLRCDGDDEGGYRVRDSAGLAMYVVRQSGGYRLVAARSAAGEPGAIALRCLERENPEAAKRWLDWIVDEQRSSVGQLDRFAGAPWRPFGRGSTVTIRSTRASPWPLPRFWPSVSRRR